MMKESSPASPANAPVTARRALLEVLNGRQPWRRPVWFMRQAGRYLPEYQEVRRRAGSFLELCDAPELACEVTLQPLRRYDLDASIVFADILLVPRALGCELDFREGEGPVLSRVSSGEDVSRLRRDGVTERLSAVYETVEQVRASLPAHVALIGFSGAPWTVASYMVEGGTSSDRALARRAAYEGQAWFDTLIELLTEAACDHLARQVEAGADVVQIFDSWAGDLDDGLRQRYCEAPIRRIVEGLAKRGHDIPVIGFARGIGAGHCRFAEATGVSAVSVEWSVPVDWMAKELAPIVPVQGNLDPLAAAIGGLPLQRSINHLVRALRADRHIFNLGHGVRPDTPPAHVAEIVRQIRALDGT
jgi:uroporphyrinogen decarboxylase